MLSFLRLGDKRRIPRVAIRSIFALLLAACSSAPELEPTDGPRDVTIYVVSHGWHTGIVVRTADVSPTTWPQSTDFANALYIEIGWGDREYYRQHDPGAGTASRAALIGGPGVLQIVGLTTTPSRAFPASKVVALPVSRQGLDRLCRYVSASYERDARGRPIELGPGLYGDGRFYASRDRFHAFNTCNVWTARALRASGLAIGTSITAGGVMDDADAAASSLAGPPAAIAH